MKTRILLAFCFLLLASSLKAQERGKVEVIKDARIDTLISRRQNLQARNPATAAINGFRVQIYNGNVRSAAYAAQAKFQEQYANIRTYLTYNEPDFKVRVGDFRTKLEAEKFRQQLQSMFSGLFIIAEKINPPKWKSAYSS